MISKTLDALDITETTASRNEKIGVLRLADQDFLRQIMTRTYNPFMVYRVTVSDRITDSDERIPASARDEYRVHQWKKFFNILDALMIGGVPKVDVEEFLSFQTMHDAKWMTRVLNRDLKAGISVGTMEVLFGKKCIPTFDVQLAEPYEGQTFTKPRYVEPKYDGLRGLAFKRDGGPWTFVSRSGKPFWNTEFVAAELDSLGLDNIVLDGEFFGDNWNQTQSVLMTQTVPDPWKQAAKHLEFAEKKGQVRFYVFDGMPLADWEAGACPLTQYQRTQMLDDIFSPKRSVTGEVLSGQVLRYLMQPPRFLVSTPEEALSYAKQWLEQGLEGGILKDLDARYTWKRTDAWIKLKFTKDVDLEITGIRDGEGRLIGVIGALEGVDPEGNRFAIGTGFSDADRVALTKLHQDGVLIGKVVECRPQDVGKGWKGTGRIAVYVRLREDKV